jgi:hypothetical protein
MARVHQRFRARGHECNAVFVGLDFFGDADAHAVSGFQFPVTGKIKRSYR